jgi:hypothetical protein
MRKGPFRKVKTAEEMSGWWTMLPGMRRQWFITTECGHHVMRHGNDPPKHIYCEACGPEGAS